jgi:NTP pyrophosphatase (non-canonical NTP hydrolase)
MSMPDKTTDIEELKGEVAAFVTSRDWDRYHNPKNLAMSISIEAAEIMEHFQWLTVDEAADAMKDAKVRSDVEEEIADVLIYCLSFANQTGIDVSEVIREKLERNEGRFPVEKIKGYTVRGGSRES